MSSEAICFQILEHVEDYRHYLTAVIESTVEASKRRRVKILLKKDKYIWNNYITNAKIA